MAFDIYAEVTNKIIEQLDNGIIPWHKPWHGAIDGAFNRISKKPYSFLNQMILKHTGEYASFKQWTNIGGKIKKGAKSEIVVFWKMLPVEETNKLGEKVKKVIPMLKYYNVFHISQVENVEALKTELIEHNPVEEAENIIGLYAERESITMEDVLGDKAFYRPSGDYLQVPLKSQFTDIMEYYSTKFHEMIHSTGHVSRLGRFTGEAAVAMFGSETYSKEELIAEIGSASLMRMIGIDTEKTFKNSVAYIQSWLQALKNDKRLIVSASGKAEKAVNYILFGKSATENLTTE